MPLVQLQPPTRGPTTTTKVYGRAATAAIGTAIAVPDFDAAVLFANGWTVAPPLGMPTVTLSFDPIAKALAGTVTNPAGSPAGLAVTITIDGAATPAGTAATAADGTFSFQLPTLSPGPHMFGASVLPLVSAAVVGTYPVVIPTLQVGSLLAQGAFLNPANSNKRRWQRPTLFNPIKIGYAAVAGDPGTGVYTSALQTISGSNSGLHDATKFNPLMQDVLFDSTFITPALEATFTRSLTIYGRRAWGTAFTVKAAKGTAAAKFNTVQGGDWDIVGKDQNSFRGGGDDMVYVNGAILYIREFASGANYATVMPGQIGLTDDGRAYQFVTSAGGLTGTYAYSNGGTAVPTDTTGNAFFWVGSDVNTGTAIYLKYLASYGSGLAAKAAYAWAIGYTTEQFCRKIGRMGAYESFYNGPAGASGVASATDYKLPKIGVTGITRASDGTTVLTCEAAHGLLGKEGLWTRGNLSRVPAAQGGATLNGLFGGPTGGSAQVTFPSATTIQFNSGMTGSPITGITPPASLGDSYMVEMFSSMAACSASSVAGPAPYNTVTLTTEAAHQLYTGLTDCRPFGNAQPFNGESFNYASTAAGGNAMSYSGSTVTFQALPADFPVGTYPNLVFLMLGGSSKQYSHADGFQADNFSFQRGYRGDHIEDLEESFDFGIGGQRFTMRAGFGQIILSNYHSSRVGFQGSIPYDGSHQGFYLCESDQSVKGKFIVTVSSPQGSTGPIDQFPYTASAIETGPNVWGNNAGDISQVNYPVAGTTRDGVDVGWNVVTIADGVTQAIGYNAAVTNWRGQVNIGDPATPFVGNADVGHSAVDPGPADTVIQIAPPPTLIKDDLNNIVINPSVATGAAVGTRIGWGDIPKDMYGAPIGFPEEQIILCTIDDATAVMYGAQLRTTASTPTYAAATDLGDGTKGFTVTMRSIVQGRPDLVTLTPRVIRVSP